MSISISHIHGRQIFDSRGNPTVEAEVVLSDGSFGRAAVPSGASTGSREAIELRDGDSEYGGKGVLRAVEHVNGQLAELLRGRDPFEQRGIDTAMSELDGTPNKANLGANAILAVSLAVAKAAAVSRQQPLHQYIAELAGTVNEQCIPLPMMNVLNGGQHAAGSTDIQEFMIIPKKANSIAEALAIGTHVFHTLGTVLKTASYATTVGDEGGYAPHLTGGNRVALELIKQAVEQAGYAYGSDVVMALDIAASELAAGETYTLDTEHRTLSSEQMIDWCCELQREFPIVSIEDGLSEDDWAHWSVLTQKLGGTTQLVGDDLFVTNTELLERGIDEHIANAILIKPNQIGSLTETIDAVLMAKHHGWHTIVSHRSGETEDATITHIAVGLGSGQIKTGSLSRSERMAKYNELLRIAEAAPQLTFARPFDNYHGLD